MTSRFRAILGVGKPGTWKEAAGLPNGEEGSIGREKNNNGEIGKKRERDHNEYQATKRRGKKHES